MTDEVAAFNRDADRNQGYLYTTNARLSSRLANLRLTQAVLEIASFSGKRVIDIGCGDGTYTRALHEAGRPASIYGIDPASSAIDLARSHSDDGAMSYGVHSAYELPFPDDSFDIAQIRGVLHHMDHPFAAMREAFRVAPAVVVVEPNGYNPVLKLLERFSTYHIEHGEKSYSPHLLDHWVHEAGGRVERHRFAGLVPMFCPDWFARTTKAVEPLVESTPLLKQISCAVYVFLAVRRQSPR